MGKTKMIIKIEMKKTEDFKNYDFIKNSKMKTL